VKQEESYKVNLLAGTSKTYFDTGSLESVTEYRSNRKHGLYTSYYPSGAVKETGEYAADKKHKEWKTFDEQGKLLSSVVFKAGTAMITEK
jgi:antitoxin component YwqK of YwqJK toxin-antitoxin module